MARWIPGKITRDLLWHSGPILQVAFLHFLEAGDFGQVIRGEIVYDRS